MDSRSWNGRGRLEQLVAELQRQQASRMDFTVDGRSLMVSDGADKVLRLVGCDARVCEFIPAGGVPLREKAMVQMGQRMTPKVPGGFMSELAQQRPTRAADLLTGLLNDGKGRHFVRVLDGSVRAVLSDRYRVLDHYDLAFAALEAARTAGGEVIECCLSDTKMQIKFTTRALWDTLRDAADSNDGSSRRITAPGQLSNADHLRGAAGRVAGSGLPGDDGNAVSPMVTVSNSETGHGGLSVRIGIFKWACLNGAIMEEMASRVHLGETMTAGVYTEETQAADSKAIMLKARDAIRGAFDRRVFQTLLDKARAATSDVVKSPMEAVDNVVKAAELPTEQRESILAYFLKDYGGSTRWGLGQAIGRAAQDTGDPEVASDLESLAGKVIAAKSLAAIGS